MQIIEYLSETKFYGSNLGTSIFTYIFIITVVILGVAVSNQKRNLAVFSYNLAIMNLLYFMAFYDCDIYRKIPASTNVHAIELFGSGVIATLINIVCIMAIAGLLWILKRMRRDMRYSF